MEAKQQNVGVLFGIISGLASILITLVLYLMGTKAFVSPLTWVLSFVVPIVFAVLAGLRQRRLQGGYIEFREALKVVFTTFVLSSVLATIFSYLLFNVIDVPFREALMQEIAESTAKFMQRMKASPEDIEKAMSDMNNADNYSIGKQTLNLAIGLIVWFIISLIIAAIVKKKKPEFPTPTI